MDEATNPTTPDLTVGASGPKHAPMLLGAAVLLAKIAIGDVLTALVALAALVLLFRTEIPNPALIAAAAVIGLVAYPMLRPAWVMLK
jgi:chromate transporter